MQVVLDSNPAKKEAKLAETLTTMSSELREARAKIPSDASVAEHLTCSQLDSVDDWLLSVAADFLTQAKERLSEGFARVSATSVEVDAVLKKLPDFADEVAFREAGVQVVQKVAGLTAKLEQEASSLKENASSAEACMNARFSDRAPDAALLQSCGEAAKRVSSEFLKQTSGLVARAGSVVALVANLCLLRSPALQAPSPSADSFEQLRDVVKSLVGKLGKMKEIASDSDEFDKAFLSFADGIVTQSKLVLARQKSVKRGSKRAAGDEAEEVLEAGESASMLPKSKLSKKEAKDEVTKKDKSDKKKDKDKDKSDKVQEKAKSKKKKKKAKEDSDTDEEDASDNEAQKSKKAKKDIGEEKKAGPKAKATPKAGRGRGRGRG